MFKYARVNGVELHYWQGGNGPDLILLHGLGGNLAIWHFTMVSKLRDKFRITTFDLRGHGRSEMPPTGYTTRDIAMDMLGLMDELGIEKSHILGHSFGADSALHFALLHPERVNRLVAIDAVLPAMLAVYMDESWEGWAYWAKMLDEVAGVKVPPDKMQDIPYLMRRSMEIPVLFGPFRGRKRDKQPITEILTATTIVDDYNSPHELTVENLDKISVPTLLIYDEGSPFEGTHQILRERLPNVESVYLPDTEMRHFSPLEQPELILDYTKAFLLPEATMAAEV